MWPIFLSILLLSLLIVSLFFINGHWKFVFFLRDQGGLFQSVYQICPAWLKHYPTNFDDWLLPSQLHCCQYQNRPFQPKFDSKYCLFHHVTRVIHFFFCPLHQFRRWKWLKELFTERGQTSLWLWRLRLQQRFPQSLIQK